jgi:hypothetical protein
MGAQQPKLGALVSSLSQQERLDNKESKNKG